MTSLTLPTYIHEKLIIITPYIPNWRPISSRFITNLCVPMIEVILHAIIDDLRGRENQEEVVMKSWKSIHGWITIAKIGLPVAYMMATLAIVVPGVINVMLDGTW